MPLAFFVLMAIIFRDFQNVTEGGTFSHCRFHPFPSRGRCVLTPRSIPKHPPRGLPDPTRRVSDRLESPCMSRLFLLVVIETQQTPCRDPVVMSHDRLETIIGERKCCCVEYHCQKSRSRLLKTTRVCLMIWGENLTTSGQHPNRVGRVIN